ncbi:MAG: hypothetical protein ACAH95_15540 [Fimbriimonas sp.]
MAALIVIGCGGGGGGGDTTGVTDGSTDGTTTGIQTGVYGTLRDSAGQSVGGATIKFYSAAGTYISQTTTRANGAFESELPTSARKFTIDLAGIPNSSNYFNQFGYGDDEYLANDPGCLAPLPAFSQGQASPFTTPVVITPRWLGPPPPPTGCLGG